MPGSDVELVELWHRSRRPHGRAADRAAAERFLASVDKPLGRVTVGDLEAFGDSLTDLTPAPRARALGAARSLLSFGHRTGYLPPRERWRAGPGRPA